MYKENELKDIKKLHATVGAFAYLIIAMVILTGAPTSPRMRTRAPTRK
jgi:hypothetical protein